MYEYDKLDILIALAVPTYDTFKISVLENVWLAEILHVTLSVPETDAVANSVSVSPDLL